MQITTFLTAALATALTVSAAPTTEAKSMMATNTPQWIIQGVKRVCNAADTSCTWTFAINNQINTPTGVSYVVTAKNGKSASLSDGGPSNFGDYTITSGVSTQFVEPFTTFAVVDNRKRLIAWPAYNEPQVRGGRTVSPDQSYAPQSLP